MSLTATLTRVTGGGLLLLAFIVCRQPPARAGADHFEEVAGWTGSYRASVRAENTGRLAMVDSLKEAQTVSAQVVLEERKISRSSITWEGTATCNASGSFAAKSSLPGSPLGSEESGSGSRIFTTPARLVIHPKRDKYTMSLCRETFTYKTVTTGTGVNAGGGMEAASGEREHKINPGRFYTSDLMPKGQLPREGRHLTDSIDIGGEGEAGRMQQMGGMEVDGKVQWSFSPDLCSERGKKYTVRIFDPSDPAEIEFSNGKLDRIFYAEPTPDGKDLKERVIWRPFDIDGSTRTIDPEDLEGDKLQLVFTGTPEKNTAFGKKEMSATLLSLESCTDAVTKQVTVFFNREGSDNGSDDPNWMWYWLQTSAGRKFAPFVRLGEAGSCERSLGYFLGEKLDGSEVEVFYICESVLYSRSADPFQLLTGKKLRSIDVFAVTVLHENQHMIDHRNWWADIPADRWPAEIDWHLADYDEDLVPDEVEIDLGYNPVDRDTLDIGFRDVEISAYRTAGQWVIGSADKEDWACPGAQGEDLVCKENPR